MTLLIGLRRFASKYGRSREHRWLKAHMCVGAKTNIVTAVIVTDGNSGASPQFSPLIKQTAEGFAIGGVSADLAYSSRNNLEVVNDVGGMPYVPFKKNAVGSARGSHQCGKRCITTSSLIEMNF